MINRRNFLRNTGHALAGAGALPALAAGSITARVPWKDDVTPDTEDYWRMVRAQFPLTRERTYFNTGGLGPASYPAIDRLQRVVMEVQTWSEHLHSRIGAVRPHIAAFIGARAEEIAFTRNATEGNSTVASGFDLRAGDEVIFESHAHPGGSVPWLNRQKQDGIKVRLFEPDHESVDGNLNRISDLITERTRVIQVSHVTAPTGLLFPVRQIAELAHDNDVWFHIDGAQSPGMIPVDVKEIGCDSFATSCHKWMCAPTGTGFLYVKQDRLDTITPTEVGAYSGPYTLPDQFEYTPTAVRYEPGTRDVATIVSIDEAISFLERIGVERVRGRGRGLAVYLQKRLREIPGVTVLSSQVPEMGTSITTFRTEGLPYDQLNRFLFDEYLLRCRVVTERGLDAIRVSTHIFNFPEECDHVVQGTEAALATLK